LATKLSNKYNVVNQPVDTVAVCTKVRIPNLFTPVLDGLLVRVRKDCLPRMLHLRECSSSKLPRNPVCRSQISHRQIPAQPEVRYRLPHRSAHLRRPRQAGQISGRRTQDSCTDQKGSATRRIPEAPMWLGSTSGVLQTQRAWLASVRYNTPAHELVEVDGVIGVDRNSVGNGAVLADPLCVPTRLWANPAHHGRGRSGAASFAASVASCKQL
jgi:hypothetical protein